MATLEVRGVTFSYDGVTNILENINLELRDGELVSLLGVSGGGKTTLFNVIAGLNRPQKGQVLLNGEDITGKTGRVSYMLQKDMLLPYRTVEDNIALPLIIKGTKKKEARKIVEGQMERFGIAGTEKKYPSQLSGGMRQRAALLRTYLFSGDVALLDEPFSALDTLTKSEMHAWYLDVMDSIRLSTVFITHDVDEAILLSDRIYILGGRPATLTDEIVIKEPKPRRKDFNLTEEFLQYKRQIISKIYP
ncbi:MAG: ABC transporter ATP-binding protein [Ruminococcus sp.]|nr:ABC transporter ATP-binding protein [Ruminococcus sp.]